MKRILARANQTTYWGLFKNFLWYKYSIQVERTHPMLGGFFRLKDRRQRRAGRARESVAAHLRRRTGDLAAWARGVWVLYFEMQEVWLATRGRARFHVRRQTRRDLDLYWRRTWTKLRHGRLFRIDPLRLVLNFLRDARLCMRFNLSFLSAYGK
jgi:hypothetical protein